MYAKVPVCAIKSSNFIENAIPVILGLLDPGPTHPVTRVLREGEGVSVSYNPVRTSHYTSSERGGGG